MKHLTLIRIAYTKDGTFGTLLDEGIPFALTIEREWEDNKEDISCIPTGEYLCRRVQSPKFGDTFEITDVENRTHILFHWGNTEDDTEGCVCVGEQFESYKGKAAVLSSKKGFKEFKQRTSGLNSFMLIIKNA